MNAVGSRNGREARVLLVDNYDSFTYNLVQALQMLDATVEVRRNDAVEPEELRHLKATHLVISPGPGRPEDAGRSVEMIRAACGRVPVLGVCLGHQALAIAMGERVGPAERLMHGKTSRAYHDGRTLFQGLPNPLTVGRYHSLVAYEPDGESSLEVSAFTSDGEVMGLRHRTFPVEGIQFHPESVLTPEGSRLLSNFLDVRVQTSPGRRDPTASGAVLPFGSRSPAAP